MLINEACRELCGILMKVRRGTPASEVPLDITQIELGVTVENEKTNQD